MLAVVWLPDQFSSFSATRAAKVKICDGLTTGMLGELHLVEKVSDVIHESATGAGMRAGASDRQFVTGRPAGEAGLCSRSGPGGT